jgi:hypothetical protein
VIDVTPSNSSMGNNRRPQVLDLGERQVLWASAGKEQEVIGTSVGETVESWIGELADQVSVSSSRVQDRLFDLWGALDDGDTRREVERWLTETLSRELYLAGDVLDRLNELALLESVN